MTGTRRRQSWLLALSDPTGPRPNLPKRRLSASDLEELCSLADRHGVLPAFIVNVKATANREGPERLLQPAEQSSSVGEVLQSALHGVEQRLLHRAALSMLLRRQAEELVSGFRQAQVPAAVIKGFVVADRLYPCPAFRPFTDLDLLVPPQAVGDAGVVMEKLGYRLHEVLMKRAEGNAEVTYRRESPGGAVEVHWDLVNSPPLRQAVSVGYDDLQWTAGPPEQPRDLTPASLLLIAAVHGAASHGFDRLQILYDVAQAVRGAAADLDEDYLTATARRTGAGFALVTALRLTETVLGDAECGRLLNRLPIRAPRWLGPLLITRGVVLRAHARNDSFRRQALRELLKRL